MSKQDEITQRQNELVIACEAGDIKAIQLSLNKGANPSFPNSAGIHPLGAAVWGMNPDVVTHLLSTMKKSKSLAMTWSECETHNQNHYGGNVFLFSDFTVNSYEKWHGALDRMKSSPFIKESHRRNAVVHFMGELKVIWVTIWVGCLPVDITTPSIISKTWTNLYNYVQGMEEKFVGNREISKLVMRDKGEIKNIITPTELELANFRTKIKKEIEEYTKKIKTERIIVMTDFFRSQKSFPKEMITLISEYELKL